MKTFFFIFFIMSAGIVSAQELTKDLEEFTEIKVYNGLNVILKEANQNRAVVNGKNRNDIIFKNDEGVLKLRMSIDEILDEKDNTKITIFFKNLNKIDGHQNSSIFVDSKFKQNFLHLNVSEGSEIFSNVNLNKLYVDANTGGVIEVEGKTDAQEININTGGKFYGKNLKSKEVKISIKAGGAADISASEIVDAKVRAGGTVNVYGNPKTIEKSILFGGKIIRKN